MFVRHRDITKIDTIIIHTKDTQHTQKKKEGTPVVPWGTTSYDLEKDRSGRQESGERALRAGSQKQTGAADASSASDAGSARSATAEECRRQQKGRTLKI